MRKYLLITPKEIPSHLQKIYYSILSCLLLPKSCLLRDFFFVCATLYIVPCYIIAKKWFQKYWFYAFLMMIGSFSFWTYGTNGIRNGIATAFFLMALASNKRLIQILWLFLAVNFHSSMLLPTAALVATWFYNRPKGFYYFWLLSIPLSLMFPGFLVSLYDKDGFLDILSKFATNQETKKEITSSIMTEVQQYNIENVMQYWKENIFND